MNVRDADIDGVWFPTIRTGTGTDVFTERLVAGLQRKGVRAEITWLPHRAEFAPFTVAVPRKPVWAQVVHVNSWLPRRFVPKDLPFVCTVHSIVHAPQLAPYKTALQAMYHRHWIRRCERLSIHGATGVAAVSQYVADQVDRDFMREAQVVLNWVDTDVFCPPDVKFPNRRFQVLYVGTARTLKGIDLLPQLALELGDNFEIMATVDAEHLRILGLESNKLRCIGRVGGIRLRELYAQCDALVFPSRAEGFGLVALEAQACGTPVVATRGSAIPEVVDDGVTGFLCTADDVMAFANAIRRLESDPEMRASMGVAARQRATTQFNEDRAVDSYLEIYRAAAYNAWKPLPK